MTERGASSVKQMKIRTRNTMETLSLKEKHYLLKSILIISVNDPSLENKT